MGVRELVGLVVLCVAAGCAQLLSLDDYESGTSQESSTSSSGADGGSSSSAGAGVAEGGGGAAASGGAAGSGGYQTPTCPLQDQIEETALLEADSFLEQGQCNEDHQGSLEYLQLDVYNRAILRFGLGPVSMAAFATRRVARIELELRRNTAIMAMSCNNGQLHTQPLRVEWDEGFLNEDNSGANWCRRLAAGDLWDADGADGMADVGTTSGMYTTDCVEDTIIVDLDPALHAPWLVGNLLALRITAGNATYYANSKEHGTEAPVLRVYSCPP